MPGFDTIGLLADVNLQGHLGYVVQLLETRGLKQILEGEFNLGFFMFSHFDLNKRLDDRSLWTFCQEKRLVLFTNDRNLDSHNSLTQTLNDSWKVGDLPVLTLGNRVKFEQSPTYALKASEQIADVLFGICLDQSFKDQPRIFVPTRWP